MRRFFLIAVAAAVAAAGASAVNAPVFAADNYALDAVHSSVSFKARHLDISWIHGRFNEIEGKFSLDKDDPGKSTFELSINADSVDSGNKGRDNHLRNPDFFDTKQFPKITFKSTLVKPTKAGYEVTGDFTMHGKTKKITLALEGGKEIEAMGMKKTGFSTELVITRSDYGMDKKMIGPIGDDVKVIVDFEGTRK